MEYQNNPVYGDQMIPKRGSCSSTSGTKPQRMAPTVASKMRNAVAHQGVLTATQTLAIVQIAAWNMYACSHQLLAGCFRAAITNATPTNRYNIPQTPVKLYSVVSIAIAPRKVIENMKVRKIEAFIFLNYFRYLCTTLYVSSFVVVWKVSENYTISFVQLYIHIRVYFLAYIPPFLDEHEPHTPARLIGYERILIPARGYRIMRR